MNIFKTYTFNYLKYLVFGKNEKVMLDFFRRRGVAIGHDCHIYSSILTPEPYLIKISNNVTIATGVKFITHDNSVCKVLTKFTDVFGKIEIGDNCFIGAYSIILPGICLGSNCIVAAGSVVTKSFPSGSIIGGNPAKVISDIYKYREKIGVFGVNVSGLDYLQKKQLVESSILLKK